MGFINQIQTCFWLPNNNGQDNQQTWATYEWKGRKEASWAWLIPVPNLMWRNGSQHSTLETPLWNSFGLKRLKKIRLPTLLNEIESKNAEFNTLRWELHDKIEEICDREARIIRGNFNSKRASSFWYCGFSDYISNNLSPHKFGNEAGSIGQNKGMVYHDLQW